MVILARIVGGEAGALLRRASASASVLPGVESLN
jgi:hypothetical protein